MNKDFKSSYIKRLETKNKELKELNNYYVNANQRLKADMAENNERTAALQKELEGLIKSYKLEIEKTKGLNEEYKELIAEVKLERKRLKKEKK